MTSAPDLPALLDDLHSIDASIGDVRARRRTSQDVRHCLWAGQASDLRKHEEELGEPAQPVEGAADTRIHLADELIGDRVALYLQSLFAAQVQAVAVESSDLAQAAYATTLLRWLRDSSMASELRHEAELAAQWVEGDDPGVAIVGIFWKQESALERRETNLQELLKQLVSPEVLQDTQASAKVLEQAQDILFNPAREQEALGLLAKLYPSAKSPALKRALRELRETGTTVLPAAYMAENRPTVVAHRLYDDIFLPLETDDIQRCRAIYRREWLSEVELRERVVSHGWDSEWVDEVLARGKGLSLVPETESERVQLSLGVAGSALHSEDFEIWSSYQRQSDDMGVPGIYATTFHGSVKDFYGSHELLDYWHGQYPFVELRREVLARGITESRGTTVVAATHQYELKVQRDARTNHTMLSTNPPLISRVRAGAMELAIRPGATIPVRDTSDLQWMQPPPGQVASVEIEQRTLSDCDRYFGRSAPGLDPTRIMLLSQTAANRWLSGWQRIFTQVYALCLQYMSPEERARVTGESSPSQVSRQEVRGRYDTLLKIDVRDLNLDFLKLKMDLIGSALGIDTMGTVNRGKLVKSAFRGIDPQIADQVVESDEDASLREVDDEQGAIVKMAAGIEVPPRESGQNYRLRSQTLQDTIGKSPELQKRLQQDQLFGQLVEARMKHFQQMLAQQQNAQIGRTGYVPVLGS